LFFTKDYVSAYCEDDETTELTILIKGNPLSMAMVAASAVFPLQRYNKSDADI